MGHSPACSPAGSQADSPILIVGATGQLGGTITRGLLERGRQVRILVRPGSDYLSLVQAGAHPVLGDLRDPESLQTAVQGVDTVITTAAARVGDDDATAKAINLQGYLDLIDRAAAAGVRRFIYTSALGVDLAFPVPCAAWKAQVEQRLQASGLEYTILQPDMFTDEWIMKACT